MNTLGDIIKNYRYENDLSLREFAELCNLSHSYIDKLEKGVDPRNNKPVIPTLDTIEKVSKAMGKSVESILQSIGFINERSLSDKNIKTEPVLTAKDEKDIAKDVDKIMTKLENQEDGPIYFNGQEVSEDDAELFRDALQLALRRIKVKNKETYTPKKYKK